MHKILFTVFVLIGLSPTTSTFSLAQDVQPAPVKKVLPAFVQAYNFGMASRENIGIALYYGDNNGNTADEIGEHIVSKVKETAALKGETVNPKFFIKDIRGAKEGVVIEYYIGGTSIGPLDIRDGIKPDTLDEVIQLRVTTRALLQKTDTN